MPAAEGWCTVCGDCMFVFSSPAPQQQQQQQQLQQPQQQQQQQQQGVPRSRTPCSHPPSAQHPPSLLATTPITPLPPWSETPPAPSPRRPQLLLGVLDGHGLFGHLVSTYLARHLPNLLHRHLVSAAAKDGAAASAPAPAATGPLIVKPADRAAWAPFGAAFADADRMLCGSGVDVLESGSTAVVCHLDLARGRVVTGWVGDSRAVLAVRPRARGALGIGGGGGAWRVVALSDDHKPERPDEKVTSMCLMPTCACRFFAGGCVRCARAHLRARAGWWRRATSASLSGLVLGFPGRGCVGLIGHGVSLTHARTRTRTYTHTAHTHTHTHTAHTHTHTHTHERTHARKHAHMHTHAHTHHTLSLQVRILLNGGRVEQMQDSFGRRGGPHRGGRRACCQSLAPALGARP